MIYLLADTLDVSPPLRSFDVTRHYGGRECVSANALTEVAVRVLLITLRYCASLVTSNFSILFVRT